MKKLILGTVTTLVALSPMMTAPAAAQSRGDRYEQRNDRNDRRADRYERRNDRAAYRNWRKGQRFDRRYAQNYREIDYRTYRGRGVYAPPRGYRWVRSGNDAVLVAITSGLIGAVIGNAIR